MEDFSTRLKFLRKEKGLLQRELAELLNLTRPAVTYYELGKRFPDQQTLKKTADFFGVSIDYLVGRTNYRSTIIPEKFFTEDNSEDNIIRELPPEAQKLLQEFKEFIIAKYSDKKESTS